MAKSKILKQLVNEEVSLEVALKRLMLLSTDLGYEELKQWAKKELNGYQKEDTLPDYRKLKSRSLVYSGINGSYQLTNNPLPLSYLNSETLDAIQDIFIYEPIKTIVEKASSKEAKLHIDRTQLAGEVYENTNDGYIGVQCTRISQIFQPAQFESIASNVSTKTLEIFMELDKVFGNLDSLDIDTSEKSIIEKTKESINYIIYDNSVNITGNAKIKNSNLTTGNNVKNNQSKIKTKNSNLGSGSNYVVTETKIEADIETNINKEKEKSNWWMKMFGRKH